MSLRAKLMAASHASKDIYKTFLAIIMDESEYDGRLRLDKSSTYYRSKLSITVLNRPSEMEINYSHVASSGLLHNTIDFSRI